MLYILALLAGIAVALQGSLNATLQSKLGLSGTLVLNALVVLSGSLIVALSLGTGMIGVWPPGAPPHLLIGGGLCGLFIITAGILAFPRLGAVATISLVIGGQMLMAVAIDHFGLLGLIQHPLNMLRLAGLVMIFLGVLLVQVRV